jgi:hypothetical protein
VSGNRTATEVLKSFTGRPRTKEEIEAYSSQAHSKKYAEMFAGQLIQRDGLSFVKDYSRIYDELYLKLEANRARKEMRQ